MALATPTMPAVPVGPARRLATIALDAIVGVVALPALWLMEVLALQVLRLDSMAVWASRALALAPCLLWLTILLALARRGRTPVSVIMRQRWVDSAGKAVSWRPLGSLSFWIAAAPVLYTLIMFGEYLYTGGMAPFMGWTDPISDSMLYIGTTCFAIVAIALPPYLRFRRQPAYVSRAAAC